MEANHDGYYEDVATDKRRQPTATVEEEVTVVDSVELQHYGEANPARRNESSYGSSEQHNRYNHRYDDSHRQHYNRRTYGSAIGEQSNRFTGRHDRYSGSYARHNASRRSYGEQSSRYAGRHEQSHNAAPITTLHNSGRRNYRTALHDEHRERTYQGSADRRYDTRRQQYAPHASPISGGDHLAAYSRHGGVVESRRRSFYSDEHLLAPPHHNRSSFGGQYEVRQSEAEESYYDGQYYAAPSYQSNRASSVITIVDSSIDPTIVSDLESYDGDLVVEGSSGYPTAESEVVAYVAEYDDDTLVASDPVDDSYLSAGVDDPLPEAAYIDLEAINDGVLSLDDYTPEYSIVETEAGTDTYVAEYDDGASDPVDDSYLPAEGVDPLPEAAYVDLDAINDGALSLDDYTPEYSIVETEVGTDTYVAEYGDGALVASDPVDDSYLPAEGVDPLPEAVDLEAIDDGALPVFEEPDYIPDYSTVESEVGTEAYDDGTLVVSDPPATDGVPVGDYTVTHVDPLPADPDEFIEYGEEDAVEEVIEYVEIESTGAETDYITVEEEVLASDTGEVYDTDEYGADYTDELATDSGAAVYDAEQDTEYTTVEEEVATTYDDEYQDAYTDETTSHIEPVVYDTERQATVEEVTVEEGIATELATTYDDDVYTDELIEPDTTVVYDTEYTESATGDDYEGVVHVDDEFSTVEEAPTYDAQYGETDAEYGEYSEYAYEEGGEAVFDPESPEEYGDGVAYVDEEVTTEYDFYEGQISDGVDPPAGGDYEEYTFSDDQTGALQEQDIA